MNDNRSVYYILATGLNRIKIGMAKNVEQRFSTIKCHSPDELELLAVEDGGRELEKEMHIKFAKYHVKGEWFDFSEAILEHVIKLGEYDFNKSRKKMAAIKHDEMVEQLETERNTVKKLKPSLWKKYGNNPSLYIVELLKNKAASAIFFVDRTDLTNEQIKISLDYLTENHFLTCVRCIKEGSPVNDGRLYFVSSF